MGGALAQKVPEEGGFQVLRRDLRLLDVGGDGDGFPRQGGVQHPLGGHGVKGRTPLFRQDAPGFLVIAGVFHLAGHGLVDLLNGQGAGGMGGCVYLDLRLRRGGGGLQSQSQPGLSHRAAVGLLGQQNLVVPDLIGTVHRLQGQVLRHLGHAQAKGLLVPVLGRQAVLLAVGEEGQHPGPPAEEGGGGLLVKMPLGDAGALLGSIAQLSQGDGGPPGIRRPALLLGRLDGGDGKRSSRQGPGQHLAGLLHGKAPHVHAADGLPRVKNGPGTGPGAEPGVGPRHDGGGEGQGGDYRNGGALFHPRAARLDFICQLSHEVPSFFGPTHGPFLSLSILTQIFGKSDYNIVTRNAGLPPGRSVPRPPGNPNRHDNFLLRVLPEAPGLHPGLPDDAQPPVHAV